MKAMMINVLLSYELSGSLYSFECGFVIVRKTGHRFSGA